MIIDSKEIQRIARLARIKVPESKYEMYANEITNIIKVIDQLQTVNTDGLEPIINVNDHNLEMRKDVVVAEASVDEVLSNAPKNKFGYFVVPKVIE